MTKELGVEPGGWRILTKPRPVREKTAGGIILIDDTKDDDTRENTDSLYISDNQIQDYSRLLVSN